MFANARYIVPIYIQYARCKLHFASDCPLSMWLTRCVRDCFEEETPHSQRSFILPKLPLVHGKKNSI